MNKVLQLAKYTAADMKLDCKLRVRLGITTANNGIKH
jgi:hypothetical protein